MLRLHVFVILHDYTSIFHNSLRQTVLFQKPIVEFTAVFTLFY